MEISKLFEVLKLVGFVESCQWKRVLGIIELIQNDRVTIAEKSWFEPYRNIQSKYYPLDLDKVDTWSTYDGDCIDLKFKIEENTLVCYATIYDGEIMHGHRRCKRFTAKLEFDADYIISLESVILHSLERLADREYENYLEHQKFIWTTSFKNTILNKTIQKKSLLKKIKEIPFIKSIFNLYP